MAKCKWCGNYYKDGLFSSGFCSKKCELEGGDRGIKKTSPFFGVIIIIIGLFVIFKGNNSENKQESKENTIEENYFSPEGNLNTTNSETKNYTKSSKDKEENNSQNENPQVNLSVESSKESTNNQELNENIDSTKNQEETVINLLNNGKSIKEISDLTGLSRREVRVISRKIK